MPIPHILFALGMVMLWGLHFPVIQSGLTVMSPWVMLALRMTGSALVFVPMLKFSWARFKHFWPFGLWVNLVHILMLFLMVQATDSSTTSLVLNGYIALTVLVSWWWFREPVSRYTVIGIAIAFIGLINIYGAPSMTWAGIFLSIPFLVSGMMRELTLKNLHQPTPFELLGYGTLCVVPFILPYSLLFHWSDWQALSFDDWPHILFVWFFQVFVMGFAVVGWQWVLARNDVSKVVPINLAQPLFAVMGGAIFLGQTFSVQLLIGGALLLVGVGMHMIWGRKKILTPAPE
jgi:O-acetylserine/cysteine efflux transporter